MAIGGMFMERAPEPQTGAESRPVESGFSDGELKDLFKRYKKEAFDNRWIWERGWMRNIHYVNNRMWIEYVRRSNEWRDVRLAKWFPKPVTPKIAEGVQVLRAMFAAVNIGTNVRPNGSDPKNVAVAAVCDDYSPILHEEHHMDATMNEGDFWFIVTGNVFLHTYFELDARHGFEIIEFEQCVTCQTVYPPKDILEAKGVCPGCGGAEFAPAMDPETGEPMIKRIPKGKGVTVALSPFELAFNNSYSRFEDVPYVIRLRWRSKDYYENHPQLKSQVAGIKWSKAPSETSLQLFRSLPYHNDMGVAPFLNQSGGQNEEEGAPDYEVWVRPCDQYPEGLVFRVLGDSDPIILHLEEDEALPGPIPYKDAEGNALFTFSHAAFEQRGGRIYGTSPLDGAIQKQNTLNQHDSFGLMCTHRMANPLWLVPKGAEIEKFTGEPGLVVKWNPLTVGGNAKPERVDGVGLGGWFFQLREQYVNEIEEAMGTSDVFKGQKPPGVDAFAAMQLLVERSQSRFASAFKSRGALYKDWFKFALEIEREFGPEERTHSIMGPARKWTHKLFKQSQLQGSFNVVVEDGSQAPKTILGERAAIEHLNGLGMIDPADTDQRYAIYQKFGMTKLAPALDLHMQRALAKQQAFEEWAIDPAAQAESMQKAQEGMVAYQQEVAALAPPPPAGPQVDPATGLEIPPDPAAEEAAVAAAIPPPPSLTMHTPLEWKPWYDPFIHEREFVKWANGDSVIELVAQNPSLEQILLAAYEEIKAAKSQAMMEAAMSSASSMQVSGPGGASMAMANSNQEAGGTGAMPGKPGAAQAAV
jgi:hypothetical protein